MIENKTEEYYNDLRDKMQKASRNSKRKYKNEHRKFVYNYLNGASNDEIIGYMYMAMDHLDRIHSEEELEDAVYHYYLYYHGESKSRPFGPLFTTKKEERVNMHFN